MWLSRENFIEPKNKQTTTTTTALQIKKSTKESQQKKPKVTKNDYFSIASSKDEANSEQFWDVVKSFSKQNSNSTDIFLTKGVCANNEEILAELFN